MSSTLIVGGSGFIGRNLIKVLKENGGGCISVGRTSKQNLNCDQIDLDTFQNFQSDDFQRLGINHIVYALGDPNMNGKSNSETEILRKFLNKLEKLQFKGRFVLVSSNAANPDSGFTTLKYRLTLKNEYIIRKQTLESIALSSELDVVVIRAPAIIGLDMNDNSHIKRILSSSFLAKLLSLRFFKGSIEILSINDLAREIFYSLESIKPKQVFEPSAPAYRWFKIARFLTSRRELVLEEIAIVNRTQRNLGKILPISLRFLIFPHWITKCKSDDPKVYKYHVNTVEILNQLKVAAQNPLNCFIVTGTASGLGAEISKILLGKNCQVIGIDVMDAEQSDSLQKFIKNNRFRYIQGDLSLNSFIKSVSELIELNEVSGIFSVAGIGPRSATNEISDIELRKIFNVNLFAPIHLVNQLRSKKKAGTFFVYVGSSAGIEGIPKFAAYSASKSALHAYFFSLICELKESEIRILGVIPSGMKTNFQKINNVPSSNLDKYLLNDPEKIAKAIVRWSEKKKKNSQIKYLGFSSYLFLVLRNFPFKVKLKVVKRLSEGTR
jgi:short-subunit dehydrogenase